MVVDDNPHAVASSLQYTHARFDDYETLVCACVCVCMCVRVGVALHVCMCARGCLSEVASMSHRESHPCPSQKA